MDRPKALALSVSLTGVIAAATAALALNFGLIGAAADPTPTTPALSGVAASGAATVDQGTTFALGSSEHESDDDHEDEGGEHEGSDAPVAAPSQEHDDD